MDDEDKDGSWFLSALVGLFIAVIVMAIPWAVWEFFVMILK